MKELEFINKLSETFGAGVSGIGDDAAIFMDKYLIAKDILVEGVHFLNTTPIEHIVHKLFTSNVSDIAAMGGEAKYALLGVATADEAQLPIILNAISDATKLYNIKLIGGDTSKSLNGLFLSLTIIGERSSNLLLRSGAKVGDKVYLSRTVGLNKVSLEKELALNDFDIDKYLHYQSVAEVELGKLLGNYKGVTSCIDISDGLGVDASRIAGQSGVKIVLSDKALNFDNVSTFDVDRQNYILSSGEEFALLFTVSEKEALHIEKMIVEKLNRVVLKVGEVREGSGVFLERRELMEISNLGYVHFTI